MPERAAAIYVLTFRYTVLTGHDLKRKAGSKLCPLRLLQLTAEQQPLAHLPLRHRPSANIPGEHTHGKCMKNSSSLQSLVSKAYSGGSASFGEFTQRGVSSSPGAVAMSGSCCWLPPHSPGMTERVLVGQG